MPNVAQTLLSVLWIVLGAALSILLTLLVVPESPMRAEGSFDVLGALGLSAGLVLFLLPITKGSDWGWMSSYWLAFGAPWGGLITTPLDLARFCLTFLGGGMPFFHYPFPLVLGAVITALGWWLAHTQRHRHKVPEKL